MGYSYPEIKKFLGLYLQANSFNVPDGAMERAQNWTITKDDRLQKRRAYYQYFDPSSDTLNALIYFQSKLLAVMNDKVKYFTDAGSIPNLTGVGTTLSGTTVAVTPPRIARNVQSNKNLYFTSDNGVLKLENYNGTIYKSGIPPGLSLQGNFLSGTGVIDDGNTVSYRYLFGRRDANDNLLLSAPSDILTLTNSTGSAKDVELSFPLPTEITTATDRFFYQVYRTSQSAGITNTDFRLIDEVILSSTQISAGVVYYTDAILDAIVNNAPLLYTNENTREGEVQANDRPPKCDDVALFKNHVLYAKVTTRHFLDSQVVASAVLASGDKISVRVDTTTRSYFGRTGVGNSSQIAETVAGAGNIVIGSTAHGLQVNDAVYVDDIVGAGGGFVAGYYRISAVSANDFTISPGGGATATGLSFEGYLQGTTGVVAGVSWTRTSNVVTVTSTAHGLLTGDRIVVTVSAGGTPNVDLFVYQVTVTGVNTFTFPQTGANDGSGNTLSYSASLMFRIETSGTVSVQIADTAKGIVKAVNRDPNSLIYGRYTSAPSDPPGRFRFQAKGFTGAIYIAANTVTVGSAFFPDWPTSFTVDPLFSRNSDLPNAFYSSKIGEPEAVPVVNALTAGPLNSSILRILALRDSVIILSQSGVFRMVGDNPSNFTVTVLDSTVICAASNSAAVLNNQVIFLSNQGVCLVTENSVQIISRKIEDVIQPVLTASTLSTETAGVAYESERLYILTTLGPNETTATISYIYNILNDSWTSWDVLTKGGIVGTSDTMYLITTDDLLFKERKNASKIDYCGQNYDSLVTAISSDGLTLDLTSVISAPEAGDVLIKDNVFSRIKTVVNNGINYTLTLLKQSNLLASDTPTLYKHYDSEAIFAPFHAGLVGRAKQISQMQIHFRNDSVNRLHLFFNTNSFGGSTETIWTSLLIPQGWGYGPWGFFPWGMTDSTTEINDTGPAPIARIYIPQTSQRCTFLQAIIRHEDAGEDVDIQAIAFSVRAYNERVTR